ncbi:MAG TPA: hypothetical protein VNL91_03290 [Thermoanaerobaculia bacterium]|nr:hypothetical protein [Thermoanaerobaculia bacterium]
MARIRRPLFWLPLVSLLVVSPLPADMITFQPKTFTAERQSIWGPGNAAPPSETTYTIINPNTVNWDFRTSGYPDYVGPFTTIDTYFWGEVSFGARARAATTGRIGLFAILTVPDPGSVDVSYTIVPTVTFPDANSFRAGDTVVIGTSYEVTDGSLESSSPSVEFELQGEFKLLGDIYAQGCLVACVATTDIGIPSPVVNIDQGRFRIFKVRTGDQFETPPILGQFTPWSGMVRVPIVETDGTPAADGIIDAAGTDEFMRLTLDLGSIAEKLFRLPPLSFDTADFGSAMPADVRFMYLVIGAKANARLKLAQNFKFDPDPTITLTFPRELEHRIVSGGVSGPVTTASSATMKIGDKLYLETPSDTKQPSAVGTKFDLDNQFHSTTGVRLAEDIDVSAGDLAFSFPEIEIVPRLCTPAFCTPAVRVAGVTIVPEVCVPEICTPRVTFDPPDFDVNGDDPLYEQNFLIAEQHLGNIFTGHWELGGFPTLDGDSPLMIDPENPILNITQLTGATTNLGGGRRRVAYAIDIVNPGDVPLSKLSVTADLAAAFAGSRGYTVERVTGCDLDLNPNFNGGSDKELLAAGNTLPVGDTKRVTLFVIISPQPDPPAYTSGSAADGRSPIDTLVGGSASSSVLLGPSIVTSARDFVLFGEHFVKLDAIANTFGHVGSNDFVEVKNGRSGVVAGDLRARKFMKVAGEISADYAFSGGVIDVVGKAKLVLSGNAKPFSTLSELTMAPAPFSPGGPLLGNVWVEAGGARAIDPGYYGYVTVNTGATLVLDPGTYHIRDLSALTGSNVMLRTPVTLFVADNLVIGPGTVFGGVSSTRDAVISALQTGAIEIGAGATIRGTLDAPRANILFGQNASIYGSSYGRSITLGPGASATFHQDCDRTVDGNCDGVPDCN